MQTQQLLQLRKQRGYEIAKKGKIVMQGKDWIVPSQTSNKKYKVTFYLDKKVCTCPDYTERRMTCKHIFAVEITVAKEIDAHGRVTITQTKKVTYPQDWVNYDKAQTQQKELFMKLLSDLCKSIPEEPKQISKGRPKMPMQDMVFSSALKVFTTFSLRRFMTDIKAAKELGYVERVPHFSLVSKYMEKQELTPTLQELIVQSAIPLKSVESQFAIDSSGFRTTRFSDYCKDVHNTEQKHQWIKAHICCGVKTNIVTAVEIGLTGQWKDNDHPHFIPLAEKTHDSGFNIQEMSADKAYNSKDNYNAINELGGVAYIPFKINTSPWGNSHSKGTRAKIWRRTFNFFIYNRDEFMEHYHKRSNVETTFFMIKAKFTDLVRSKTPTAQTNEVLLKVLCHNITVVIQEMFELGIEPDFLGGN